MVNDTPKVSIVMAYYNRRRQLLHTLFMLTFTSHKNLEVIIVDDGSSDEHRLDDITHNYWFPITLIRIERQKRWWSNPCVPYNIGFNQASGQIIIIQNPECAHYGGDLVADAVRHITDTNYISYACYSASEEETKNLYEGAGISYSSVGWLVGAQSSTWMNHPTYRPVGYHFLSVITAKNLSKLKGFDETFAYGVCFDDDDLLLRIKKLGLDICLFDERHPIAIHLYHPFVYDHTFNDKYETNRILYHKKLTPINIFSESPPGWALYPLTSDATRFLESEGYTFNYIYWDVTGWHEKIQRCCTEPIYGGTALCAEELHQWGGVPRENIKFIFHSVFEMRHFENLYKTRYHKIPKNLQKEIARNPTAFGPSFKEACSKYRKIGYMSFEQKSLLHGMDNIVHVPQYVDTERFHRIARSRDNLTIGAAVSIDMRNPYSVAKRKKLLQDIVNRIQETSGLSFDSRCIRYKENRGLSYDQMPDYYNDIDVLICTSYCEGGPLSPIQAGACGVPTISTICGHIPEFIVSGVTGFIVEPRVESFMEKIILLRDNPGLLHDMSFQVEKHVQEHWSVKARAQNIRDFFLD